MWDENARLSGLVSDTSPVPAWVLIPETGLMAWANAAARPLWNLPETSTSDGHPASVRETVQDDLRTLATRLADGRAEVIDWTIITDGVVHAYSCCAWQVIWRGQTGVAFIALPEVITPATAAELQRDRILSAVAEGAQRLVAKTDGLTQAVDLVMALGQAADVDRSYLFHFLDRPPDAPTALSGPPRVGEWVARQVFEWCAPGIPPEIDNADLHAVDMVAAGFVRWMTRFRVGLPIVCSGQEDMPASEWEFLSLQGITAICVQPIRVDGRLIGFIGFDVVAANRDHPFYGWTAHSVDALATGAHLLAAAFRMAELSGLDTTAAIKPPDRS